MSDRQQKNEKNFITNQTSCQLGGRLTKIKWSFRAELRDRKWKRRRSPENVIILGVLFQLLYIDHPELLVDVIEAAKKSIADGASKDEATLQDLQVTYLYRNKVCLSEKQVIPILTL